MGVRTTADEALSRAIDHIEKAREEVGRVMIEKKTMWGADDFKKGYIENLFRRLDALLRASAGDDVEGNAQAAKIEQFDPIE